MAKTPQQYYEELIANPEKQLYEKHTLRQQADDQQKAQINAAVDQAVQNATSQYEQRIAALPDESRELYDANALDEAVSRTRVQEYLANMGMTDSGLTSSMATALSVQKGKADRQVRMNEQQQRQSLMAAIDQIVAEGETKKTESAMSIDAATRQWYDETRARLEESAWSGAASAYAADQEYAAKVAEAQIKAQQDYTNQRRQYVQKQMMEGTTAEQAWANGYAVYPVTEAEDKNYKNINNYYAMLRSGYTEAEINAYNNAGGGEAGAEAMEALAYSKAEPLLKSINMDITEFLGKTFWNDKNTDGRFVAESIEQQFNNNPQYAAMSKTEKEVAAAAAIGQMVATSWNQHSDSEENETRLEVACNIMGVDPAMAKLYYDKYKNNTPDLRHI